MYSNEDTAHYSLASDMEVIKTIMRISSYPYVMIVTYQSVVINTLLDVGMKHVECIIVI